MKNAITNGIAGLLLTLGVIQTRAATTNYWVQNVNLKLTAYVQEKATALHGSLPTKQFLAFLSGITNPALVSAQSVAMATNGYYTNLTIEVTNSWLLPITAAPPGDLPRSYTVTSDYVLTPDGGVTFYTNNVNFTNDAFISRTDNGGITYTFNNTVTVPTNRVAYLLPELPAASLTAVWTNHGPGTVFVLNGWVLTNSVVSVTNYTYGTNPDFTKGGAKLLLITPIIGGTNYPSKFVVRYKNGKQTADVDVSNFMAENAANPYVAVYDTLFTGRSTRVYGFSGIDFNNQAGTSFNFAGFDTQAWSITTGKKGPANASVLKQRAIAVGNYAGYISGKIRDRTFNYSTTVVRGTISINGGKFE